MMKQQFISIKGLSLCFCEWGERENPTIIILHGWLDQAAAWSRVAEGLLEKGYHIIALEHRGHGLSEHLPDYCDYHFPDYIADVQELVRQLALKNFVLIGHSMGGTISCIYTALCPVKPRRLVLIDGVGTRHENEEKAALRYTTHLEQRRRPARHRIMDTRKVAREKLRYNHPYLSEQWAEELVFRITKSVGEGWSWTWDPRHKNRSAVGFHLPRFLELLGQITAPTTLIFGGNDWYAKLADLPARIKAFPAPPQEIILPTSHSPHLENPSLLIRAILVGLEGEA